MKWLICGSFSFNHIYFLLYAVFRIIHQVLKDFLKISEIADNFFFVYLIVLSRLLSFIPFLIHKKLSKIRREEKERKDKNKIKYIYHDQTKEGKKKLAKHTFIIALCELLGDLVICIFYFFNKETSFPNYHLKIFLIFNTVTQYIANYYILNFHFYKHHYLSFWINFGCLILFLIVDVIELVTRKISQYHFYILACIKIVKYILLSIKDNFSKKVLFEEYLSVFSLMLIVGLYELAFLAVFSVPFIFLKSRETKNVIFIDFLEYLKGTKLILSISILICKFVYALFILLIIDRFSPSHLPLAFLLDSFFNNIYTIIKNVINHKQNRYYVFANFAFYAILFIGAMIHNEIIIINKCGLSKNTKMFLDMKFEEEKSDLKIPTGDDDENYISENRTSLTENTISVDEVESKK